MLSDEGAERGGRLGLLNQLMGLGQRRELPIGVRGRAPAANAFLALFEVHRTLLVERTVPTKPVFFLVKIHSIDDWGHGPLPPLNTTLVLDLANDKDTLQDCNTDEHCGRSPSLMWLYDANRDVSRRFAWVVLSCRLNAPWNFSTPYHNSQDQDQDRSC